ncbi:MAG: serpin family protein [Candidatus Contendobacter sp.]
MAALLALAGCITPTISGVLLVPSGRPLLADPKSNPSEQLTGAINDFGLALVKATPADSRGNVIVSPASVHAALSMTANGASGETAQQMRTVLHTDSMSPTDTNRQWASLLGGLASRSSDQTLEIANALWARKGIAFKKPFVDADRDYFGAQVSTLDFAKDDVAGAINDWVSKNTHGMITRMVDEPPANAILYLANAVYFKGDWITPFPHEGTRKKPFTRADGSKVDVDMMNTAERMPYIENETLQATRLPYKGDAAAYYVMLPRQGVSLDAAMASLKGTGFADLRATMTSRGTTEVILGLPKLDADLSANLNKPLATMGMPRAFDQKRAEFSGMAELGVPIYIGDVLHKTKVKVDEKGTVAAAATVVGMKAGSAAPAAEPPRIICDRPYAFAIVDEKSGAILFLGAVNDPGK